MSPLEQNTDDTKEASPMSMTKYQAAQLRKAARDKGMRHATYGVFSHLVTFTWSGQWPATQRALVGACNVSPATFARVTADLISHLWVTRTRGGGKGNPTRYTVMEGEPWPRKVAKTDAERMRAYRARLRGEDPTVTKYETQTASGNGPQTDPTVTKSCDTIRAGNGPTVTSFWRNASPSDQRKHVNPLIGVEPQPLMVETGGLTGPLEDLKIKIQTGE